jgi:DnaK suppressor protein
VDDERAKELLDAERARLEQLLGESDRAAQADRAAEDEEAGGIDNSAEALTTEGTDNAIAASIREQLQALERAESRLAAGTFGRSLRSGQPIPDERLEANPMAELTVDEANEQV